MNENGRGHEENGDSDNARIRVKKNNNQSSSEITEANINKTKPTKKKKHTMGISISEVAKKGKQPSCMYCYQPIGRGVWHTIKTAKIKDKQWNSSRHYHFECINHLSDNKQKQLLAIVAASSYIDNTVREQLAKDIETVKQNRANSSLSDALDEEAIE